MQHSFNQSSFGIFARQNIDVYKEETKTEKKKTHHDLQIVYIKKIPIINIALNVWLLKENPPKQNKIEFDMELY